MKFTLLTVFLLALLPSAAGAAPAGYPVAGSVDGESPALDALIPPGATVEKIAEGITWAEGPV